METRIFFKDNPYPGGHRIKKFVWSATMDPEEGLYFHFHLETDDYYAEDVSEEEDENETVSDWDSKIVWGNYHSCKLSSTAHGNSGIHIAAPGEKFDFGGWETLPLTVDTLPLPADWEYDDLAFSIYLLGHDSVANHNIRINRQGNNTFRIHWTGNIALTYAGDDEFKHSFEANVDEITFDGIYYPKDYTQEQALALLGTLVQHPEHFVFRDLNPKSFKREYKLALQ